VRTEDTSSSLRIGFIGAGRVASALARGFARAGYAVTAVASRSGTSARSLARAVPGCRAYDGAQAAADRADLVFLTVPDDEIARVAAEIAWPRGGAAVHCSGATGVDALAPAARAGAQTGGFHPLQTFTAPETALAGLRRCVVAIEAEEPLAGRLRALASGLGARPIRLPPGTRALYHGAGSFAASFVVALLHEAVQLWRGFGVPEEEALAALLPLARGTLDAVAELGTVRALAGPISRGDVGTVVKHVQAFAERDRSTLDLYRVLARRTVPIALAKGALTPEQAAELTRILGAAD